MAGLLATLVVLIGAMLLAAAYLGVTRSLWLAVFLIGWVVAIVTFGTIIN